MKGAPPGTSMLLCALAVLSFLGACRGRDLEDMLSKASLQYKSVFGGSPLGADVQGRHEAGSAGSTDSLLGPLRAMAEKIRTYLAGSGGSLSGANLELRIVPLIAQKNCRGGKEACAQAMPPIGEVEIPMGG